MKRKITSHFSHNTVSHNYTYASKVHVNCVEIIYYNIYWLFNMRKRSPNLGINTINTNITFPKFVLIVYWSVCVTLVNIESLVLDTLRIFWKCTTVFYFTTVGMFGTTNLHPSLLSSTPQYSSVPTDHCSYDTAHRLSKIIQYSQFQQPIVWCIRAFFWTPFLHIVL